jgi:hypothetical protein
MMGAALARFTHFKQRHHDQVTGGALLGVLCIRPTSFA